MIVASVVNLLLSLVWYLWAAFVAWDILWVRNIGSYEPVSRFWMFAWFLLQAAFIYGTIIIKLLSSRDDR